MYLFILPLLTFIIFSQLSELADVNVARTYIEPKNITYQFKYTNDE